MIWGVGEGGWVGMQEFSEKFPVKFRKIFGKFPGKCVVIRKREIDLVNREIKIFQKFLEENTSETMPDPPVTQLRNGKFRQIYRVFPTPFICKTAKYVC